MAESRTAKYIVEDMRSPSPLSISRHRDAPPPNLPPGERGRIQLLYMDDSIMKGSFYVECVWIMPGSRYPGFAERVPHYHDFDEVVSFIGSDVDNPYDLGDEIEMWLDGEQHILTKTCLIFVPKGMKHCPLIIRRVDRPIYHAAVGTGPIYLQDSDKRP